MKTKKGIFFIIAIVIFVMIPMKISYAKADDNKTIEEQQEEFKIQDFIKNSKQYTGEFFENMDINELLNNAIKGKVDNTTLAKKY